MIFDYPLNAPSDTKLRYNKMQICRFVALGQTNRRIFTTIYNADCEVKPQKCFKFGWGGRDRTCEWRHQKPLPYRLATPQHASGPAAAARLISRDMAIATA
jgi:hypothetical protein